MIINFLTLFPDLYEAFMKHSIFKRAIEKGIITVNVVDFRKYTLDKHNKVDDVAYGGGSGMLLMVEPIDRALQTVGGRKIMLSPQGTPLTQAKVKALASEQEITLLAGHYEGFDERVLSLVDEEISIGDYVLTGGELPSLIIADAVTRLLPGVIAADSHANESFEDDLLDYPQYTRPREYKGMSVPDVLLSGNHAQIAKWRREMQVKKTMKVRPDLLRRKHEK